MNQSMLTLAGLGSFAIYAAPLALIATFWGQLRNWFAQLRGFLIVTVQFNDDDATHTMMDFVWKEFKRMGRSSVAYGSRGCFVIPNDRYEHIGIEYVHQNMIFRKGWKFLFITLTGKDEHKMQVTCLRGLFDLEALYLEALDLYNERQRNGRRKDRYSVTYRFGRRGKDPKSGEVSGEDSKATASARDIQGMRVLRYKMDDLGEPVEEKPFSHLAYPPDILEFLSTITHWKNSERWFKSKHLPYRKGALLKGKPGTGKSSFVKAMAQEVDLPIEIFDLTTFTNEDMIQYWGRVKERTPIIVLFEDIDRLFDETGKLLQSQDKFGGASLTLDCLLNCISGVLPSDGIFTIATANFPERLDPALTRPGRLDSTIEFGDLGELARRTVASRILSDCPEFIERCIAEGAGETGAQFTKRCGDIAIKHFWETVQNQDPMKLDSYKPRFGPHKNAMGQPPALMKQPVQPSHSSRIRY